MIQLVEETAQREKACSVKTIVIELGCLSSVDVDALRFAFDLVKSGGPAEGAVLSVIDIPGEGTCGNCNATAAMTEIYATCPRCGSPKMQAVQGTQMRVREIEIA